MIPIELEAQLKALLEAHATGTLVLDVKDGKILSLRFEKSRRVDKLPRYALR